MLDKVNIKKANRVAIAGNTAMLHILLNLPCHTLGEAPFTPVTLELIEKNYAEVFGQDLAREVIILPGFSTFAGADLASGLLAVDWKNCKGYNLLIDLGTNCEMALFSYSTGKIYVTAAAAGPAFRRADINGTNMIDLIAELLKSGQIDTNGRISNYNAATLSQEDISEIQLAKSAVRAGIEILLNNANICYDTLEKIFLAGTFGEYINVENAGVLGLFPQELIKKVTPVGNSSLMGCIKLLENSNLCDEITQFAKSAEEINLANHPQFYDLFITHMNMG